MIKNIILIIFIILLLFFFSNNDNVNNLFEKKYIKYLFILLIVYFIYENYNFTIFAVAIIILIFLNVDIKEKFNNNNYLSNFNYDNLKKILNDYFGKLNTKISKEFFENNSDGLINISSILNDNNISNGSNESNNEKREPFKNNVLEIKSLFESIKDEINKLKN